VTTAFISLHDQSIELCYPESLQERIELLFGPRQQSPAEPNLSISVLEAGPGRYSVSTNGVLVAGDLSAETLLDVLLEEVVRSLIVKLGTAVALHAASVGWGRKSVVIAGPTGSGKTSLTGFLVAKDFEFLSDELVLLTDGGRTTLSFPRPLLAKPGSDKLLALLAQTGRSRTLETGANTVIALAAPSPAGNQERQAGLIIFPNFVAGSDLEIARVSPGLTGARLMECNLNARNFADHGLRNISAFARNVPAITVKYGSFEQLDGVAEAFKKILDKDQSPAAALEQLAAAFPPPQPRHRTEPTAALPTSAAPAAEAAIAPPSKKLTIGMATYDDYDGVFFTLHAIRLYHPEILEDAEFVIIDNNPDGRCAAPLKDLANWVTNYRYVPKGEISGTAVRDWIFREARGEIVLCVDCHILIVSGALKRLLDYFDAHPGSKDLLQGPLIYEDLKNISTHFKPEWREGMYGTWETSPDGLDPEQPPFDIPMQGLGLFACRRDAWPGFNPAFRGFGGEEGYIHEKIRQRGGRTLCLPFLRWLHRFNRPMGLPYGNHWEDRVRNYFIGLRELGLDTAPMIEHFKTLLGPEVASKIIRQVEQELAVDPAFADDPPAVAPSAGDSSAQRASDAPPPSIVSSQSARRSWLEPASPRFEAKNRWLKR
jgi:hypothetical protein